MLRWFVTLLLLIAFAGWLAVNPLPSPDSEASFAAGGGLAPGADFNAAPARGDDDDHDDHDECDNSGPGNCEDRDDDRDVDEDDLVPVTDEIPEGSIVIEIVDDDFFSPSTLTVDAGQSVTFVNRHDDVHTATGSGFDTGDIPPGTIATVTLDEPGAFAFACRYHPEMTGEIAVRGEDGIVPPPETSAPPPADATAVDIVDFAFSPASITIEAGTTVVWTNGDSVPHTATAENGGFDSGVLDPGGTFSFSFDEPGDYAYFCAIHPDMQGTITVVAGDSSGAPPAGESDGDDTGIAGEGEVTASMAGPFIVSLMTGDCADPGATVADLENATVAEEQGDDESDSQVIPVAVSVTILDETVSELIDGNLVVAVMNDTGQMVACGALGGPAVAGEVVVGLGDVDDSGVTGVAVLHEERAGATATVYLTGIAARDGPAVIEVATLASDGASVTIVDFAFAPPTLEIPVGATVTWTNEDSAPHTATADDGGFDTGRLDQGQSASQTFNEVGAFTYHCDFHPEMTGTIVVE